MRRRAYLALGRGMSPLFIIGLRFYTLLTDRPRVRILVVNERDEVLLIKGVVSDGKWTLPGGGAHRKEALAVAAQRELLEETGIKAPERDFVYATTLARPQISVTYKAPLFVLRVKASSLPARPANRWEIAHIEWFKRTELPEPISRLATTAITKYFPMN